VGGGWVIVGVSYYFTLIPASSESTKIFNVGRQATAAQRTWRADLFNYLILFVHV